MSNEGAYILGAVVLIILPIVLLTFRYGFTKKATFKVMVKIINWSFIIQLTFGLILFVGLWSAFTTNPIISKGIGRVWVGTFIWFYYATIYTVVRVFTLVNIINLISILKNKLR